MSAAVAKQQQPELDIPSPMRARHKRSPRSGARTAALKHHSADQIWVAPMVAEAILQVSRAQVYRLCEAKHLRKEKRKGMVNLGDILVRYQQLLRTNGALEEKVEAVCVREFESGRLPQDVIVDHQYNIEPVMIAWKNWKLLKSDPVIAQASANREEEKRLDEAARCRDCLRTPSVSKVDALRIVKDVTGEERERFTMTEERAFADLDVRCPRCRQLKATAPIETMRARARRVNVMGDPKPIELAPLPTNQPEAATPSVQEEEKAMKTPDP